ncbi:MAG: manganese catalase family protein [Acidobacteriota bacterium]|nr:manganese catalase family protein [Acidobacteriota bacterium]
MKPETSIALLNRAAGDELAAVHQYMYFHFHLDDQGYKHLAGLFKRTAIQEMGHVELLADRILFLKGDVNMVAAEAAEKITAPAEMMAKAVEMERSSARDYNRAALDCSANEDAGSKQLFEQLIHDEETHFAGFEKQLDSIREFGPNYLALQSVGSQPEREPGT